jgi:hypothetical protein
MQVKRAVLSKKRVVLCFIVWVQRPDNYRDRTADLKMRICHIVIASQEIAPPAL